MKSFKACITAGLFVIGTAASPTFAGIEQDMQRYDQLVDILTRMPADYSTEYCLVAQEAAQVLQKISSTGKYIRFDDKKDDGGRRHRHWRGVWEKDTRVCISQGFLPDNSVKNTSSPSTSSDNDIGGFMDELNKGLGLNIELNPAPATQEQVQAFYRKCKNNSGYVTRTFDRRGYGGTDKNFYECWANGGIRFQIAP